MEALIVVLTWSAIWLAVAAAYCGYCEHREEQEGQALARTYIQHLQAARKIAIQVASSGQTDWLQSQKLFAAADQLQDMIIRTRQDYMEISSEKVVAK